MKIPKKLKIGGHEVKVVFPYHFKERFDLCGQYDDGVKEIRIAEVDGGGGRRAQSGIWVSLIHEILHAIDINSGHGIFKDMEPAIEGISNGIFQVLVDNGFLNLKE